MKSREYDDLYRRLHRPEDIDRVAQETGYDRELLLVIHTQRITRDATKKFYKVKRDEQRMLWQWQRGTALVQIAAAYDFPPVLTAQMILLQGKLTRRQFWACLANPASAPDGRLRRELKDVVDHDIIYSPKGMEVQYERGRRGEARLQEWLRAQGLEFKTEVELRKQFEKTPDALLKAPLPWNGSKLAWIESKATVGDPYEVRRHVKRQLQPYTEMFGDGLVVYWFGFVEDVDLKVPEGVAVVDASAFNGGPLPPPSATLP